MLPPVAAKVNVDVVIVAGFIILLNTAVTTTLGQLPAEAFGGSSETTVGGVSGEPGFPVPAFLSGSPHPETTAANTNARVQSFLKFELGITFSSLRTCKAIH